MESGEIIISSTRNLGSAAAAGFFYIYFLFNTCRNNEVYSRSPVQILYLTLFIAALPSLNVELTD